MNQMFSISFVDMFANGLIAVLAMIVMLVVTINSTAPSKYGYAYFEISLSPCEPDDGDSDLENPEFIHFIDVEYNYSDIFPVSLSDRPTKCASRYVVLSDGEDEITRTLRWIRPVERSVDVTRWTGAEDKLILVGRDFSGNPIQGCVLTFNTETEIRFTASGVSCINKEHGP